ncbi:phosphoribosylformimino-5-aminoimidazole carboxamide ribotide isomerase [Catalinimonas alkaloidigena]|uniref:1-(5-phosphoribosyl)-5-[(5-phosphoribosylamino)methylideneamino] imidazole-4-carboxamide isomerase n=1 Tax=Catalinimonas alkaloidigena TaxID=1075417 RepID=A0A1G9EX25_9BACT|nr:1-(5-phosphoribosyl)-5-[(5-phosphoribosylamino)methylideneamino] imidazole-4-carboxamide isomerase [Catalinimonas alkaloidigena]SDK80651.1 phosphoribosylformimino-5-aminoimidazole carboxamide ribotide isomerase [Catalinimonas alkaloidigena]
MIEIIPALSVSNGKCIRLTQGDFTNPTVYDYPPLQVAKAIEEHGFRRLQYQDLDGAIQGKVVNTYELRMIAAYTTLKIDFSGGIRTDGDVHTAFEYGAYTLTSNSVAVNNPELFTSWLTSYGRNKIVLAADCFSNGAVATRGWQKKTDTDVIDHIQYYYDRSILHVKCTDISRDGVMEGPNFDLYKRILDHFPDIRLMASGGVRSLKDIEELQKIGCHGVIIGKALYEGRVKLAELEKFVMSQA